MSRNTGTTTRLAVLVLGIAVFGLVFSSRDATVAQSASQKGIISGTVTADQGVVRAFRVQAKEANGVAYAVFTNKGRYQIFNLPPGSYQVQVVEDYFESPVQSVAVKGAETKTVNISLKAKPDAIRALFRW